MKNFNNGQPYHGSDAVENGKLTGATGMTDYFFFICPKCPDTHIMRILDYGVHHELPENPANEHYKKKTPKAFTLVFKIYCEQCKLQDFVKVGNIGLQEGNHKFTLHNNGQAATAIA
jgi:hypothetical protein